MGDGDDEPPQAPPRGRAPLTRATIRRAPRRSLGLILVGLLAAWTAGGLLLFGSLGGDRAERAWLGLAWLVSLGLAVAASLAGAWLATARRALATEPVDASPLPVALVAPPSAAADAGALHGGRVGAVEHGPAGAEERGISEIEALYAVSRAMGGEGDLVSGLEQALGVVCTVSRMEAGEVVRADTSAGTLVQVAQRGLPPPIRERVRRRSLEASHLGQAILARRATVTDLRRSTVLDPDLREMVAGAGWMTQLSLPIAVNGETWGGMMLLSATERAFDVGELQLLEAVAHQIGLAVARASLLAETIEKSRRLETLTRLTQTLTATLSTEVLLQRVVEAALELFGPIEARLFVVEGEDQLYLAASSGTAGTPPLRPRFAVGEGLVGAVAATRAPVIVADLLDDPRLLDAERVRAMDLGSFAGVPLLLGARLLGVLTIAGRERHEYTREETGLLQSLADHAAVAIDNARLFTDEQARRAYLAALLEINKKIGAMEATEALLGSIAEEAARLLNVDNAGFRLVDGDELVAAGLAGLAGETMRRPRIRVGESLSGRVVAEGKTLVLDDISAAADTLIPEHYEADRRLGYTTFLGVPLRIGSRIIGVLTFRARRPFAAREQELAEAFAGQSAVAIEHARLYVEAARQAQRMTALADVERLLAERLEPDVVAQRIADSVCFLLGVMASAVYRLDPDRGDLHVIAAAGEDASAQWVGVLPRGTGLSGLAVRERRPVSTTDVLVDRRIVMTPETRSQTERARFRTLLAVPLVIRDAVIGTLTIGDREGRRFSTEEVRLAEAFADQAAVALENARLFALETSRRTQIETLAEIERELAAELNRDRLLGLIVERASRLFAARGAIFLVQGERALVPASLSEEAVADQRVPFGHGLVGACAETRHGIRVDDYAASPHALPQFVDTGLRCCMVHPLLIRDRLLGVIGMFRFGDTARPFGMEDVRTLESFATQAAVALENARLYDEAERRRRQAEEQASLARMLTESLDLTAVGEHIVRSVLSLLGVRSSGLRLLQPDGSLVSVAWAGAASERYEPARVLAPGLGLAGRAVAEGRPVWSTDIQTDPDAVLSEEMSRRTALVGHRAVLVVPLRAKGTIIGTLFLADDTARAFTESEITLAQTFADQAALALENARLHEETERRRRTAEHLGDLGRLVSQSLDPEEVGQRTAESIRSLLGSLRATLFRVDPDSGGLDVVGLSGEHGMGREVTFPPATGVAGLAARERRLIVTADPLTDPRISLTDVQRRHFEQVPIRSMAAVPLLAGDAVLGVLSVGDRAGRVFTDEEIRLLETFADRAAAAFANARLYVEAVQRQREAEQLATFARTLTETLDVATVGERIVGSVTALLRIPSSGLRLVEPDGSLRAVVYGGAAHGQFPAGEVLPPGVGVAGRAVAEARPVWSADVLNDPGLSLTPELRQAIAEAGLSAFLSVPLRAKGVIIGVLTVADRAPRVFSVGEAALLQVFADQAALALENARLHEETEARRREAEVVAELARTINASLDLGTVLQRVAEGAKELCGSDMARIALREPASLAMTFSHWVGARSTRYDAARVEPGQGVGGLVLATGRPFRTDDYPHDARFEERDRWLSEEEGTVAELAVPIRIGDRVEGLLYVDNRSPRPFTDRDEAILLRLADHTAVAIQNARLYETVEVRAARLHSLARLNQLVSSSLDAADVLPGIARAAAELMDVPFVTFWIADEAAATLEIRTFSDHRLGADFPFSRVRFGEGTAGWVALHREPLTIDDVSADPRFLSRDWTRAHGLPSFLGLPIVFRDSLLGVLTMNGRAPFRIGPDTRDLLESFVAQAAVSIWNARLYRDARDYAERLRALDEVNRLLSSSLQMDEVMRNLAAAVARFFDASHVSVWVSDPVTGRLRRSLSHGDPRVHAGLPQELAPGEGGAGWVALHREPLLWVDVAKDPRVIHNADMIKLGLNYLTAFPIAIGDRVLGAFGVNRAAPGPVTPETLSLLGSLAAQAALALDHARLYAETSRRLAETRMLLEVVEILNSTLEARQLLKRATMKIAQVCDVDRCSLWVWQGDRVVPLMSQFADGRREPSLWQAFVGTAEPRPPTPAHHRVTDTRRPVVIDDTSDTDLIPAEVIARFGIKSYMAVPLMRQDQVIGVMTFDCCTRSTRFEAWQVDLGMAIGGQVALALENTRLYAEVQGRLRETSTLLFVAQALSQLGSPEEVMRRVAREVTRAFGADMTGAYVATAGGDRLVPLAGHHVPEDLVEWFRTKPIVISRSPWVREAWESGHAVSSSDPKHEPRFDLEWVSALPPHSVLFAPTRVRGESVGGLFIVWWQTGRTFDPAEIRLVEGVAAQVGLAMENAELARQTQAKLRETEALLAVSRPLSQTLDRETMLRHFLRQLAKLLGADTMGAWLVDESGEWLEPIAGYHIPHGHLPAIRRLRVSLVRDEFYAEAARTRRSTFTSNAGADPRVPRAVLAAAPHRSQLFAPIVIKDQVVGGFLGAWWERHREFGESELALVEAIANQAGVALDNARLFGENRRQVEELVVLHELSRAVTGQLDRAALMDAIRTQVPRVLQAQNMAVLLWEAAAGEMELVLRVRDGSRTDAGERFRPGIGLMTIVYQTGRALRTEDYGAECRRRGTDPVASISMLRHWLGVPMAAGPEVLGVLTVSRADPPYTEAEERLLGNIADLAALALRSARLYEERTRAYDELAAAQDQLVRTEKLRALGEMASGVAHDFNNLLAAILGRAQLLLRRVQDEKLVQWLKVIERSAEDGAQTVRRLQEFTRIRRDAPLVAVDLNQVVRDAVELTQSRWGEESLRRGITLDVRTSLTPIPPVAGDAAELREAMTNLILNAVDAMPEGGKLTLASRLTEDQHLEITVSDTGVGMPDEVRRRIFDPFFTTKGPQGTGLGLSMTYGILSRHAATITVESEQGKGTTFRLRFVPSEGFESAARGAAVPGAPVASLRCLVVDDEEPVGTVIADVLETSGHTVVVATNGAAAIERFRAEPFDVVFTDLAMPGLSGWQVARAVKALAPRVPVFLVTGFGVELSADERRAHGVDAIFAKPLRIEEIIEAAARVARSRTERPGAEGETRWPTST